MDITYLNLPRLSLAGMSFYGDPFDTSGVWTEENQIGRLWNRLTRFCEQNPDFFKHSTEPGVSFEVHISHEETAEKGLFEVFVGVQINNNALEVFPAEMLHKVLPASDYAVLTLTGEEILFDWYMEIDPLLEESGYRRAGPYSFQRYDERFLGVDRIAESVVDVYLPVRKTVG